MTHSLTKENAMTTTTIAANAVAAAHIQGLQAFMASEVKERATDAQLEAATGLAGVPTGGWQTLHGDVNCGPRLLTF